jgi:hypothetical protein
MTDGYIDAHFDDIFSHGSDIESRIDESYCTKEWIKEANAEYINLFEKDQVLIDKDYESAINSVISRLD